MIKIGVIIPYFYPSNTIRKAFTMLSWQTRKDVLTIYMVNDCSPHTDCEYSDIINEFSN
jgi:hypothetical protein